MGLEYVDKTEAFDVNGNQFFVGCSVTCTPGKENEYINGTGDKIGDLIIGEVVGLHENGVFIRVKAIEERHDNLWVWWVCSDQIVVADAGGVGDYFSQTVFDRMLGVSS